MSLKLGEKKKRRRIKIWPKIACTFGNYYYVSLWKWILFLFENKLFLFLVYAQAIVICIVCNFSLISSCLLTLQREKFDIYKKKRVTTSTIRGYLWTGKVNRGKIIQSYKSVKKRCYYICISFYTIVTFNINPSSTLWKKKATNKNFCSSASCVWLKNNSSGW